MIDREIAQLVDNAERYSVGFSRRPGVVEVLTEDSEDKWRTLDCEV